MILMKDEKYEPTTQEEVHIDYLLYDVLIIKAESIRNEKAFQFADYLEKQLLGLKNGDKVLEL